MKTLQSIINNIAKLFSYAEKPVMKNIVLDLAACYVDLKILQSQSNEPEVQVRIDDAVESARETINSLSLLAED